jgi:GTP-binding protein
VTATAPDPLPIRSVTFLGGMTTPGGWRPATTLPEVAVGGRSNVGKSSLLNRLMRRRAAARVSSTPGRTRQVNFFDVNGAFLLADLPGYGYARVSKAERAAWKPLIEGYVTGSPELRGVIQLLDARREPSDEDRQMLDWLADVGIPTLVVVTKVDKLRPREVAPRLAALAAALALDEHQVMPFSSVTGEGRDALAAAVVALLAAAPWRAAGA